jgi:hypothetical protein
MLCEPYLSMATTKSDANVEVDRVLKALFESGGMARDEAEKLDIRSKSNDELVELFKKLGAMLPPRRLL